MVAIPDCSSTYVQDPTKSKTTEKYAKDTYDLFYSFPFRNRMNTQGDFVITLLSWRTHGTLLFLDF